MEISFFVDHKNADSIRRIFEFRIILPNWVEFLVDHKIVTVCFSFLGKSLVYFSLSSTSKQTQKPQETGVFSR